MNKHGSAEAGITMPLGILCVRVSAEDRATLAAVATLSRDSISGVVRDLVRGAARERLRELATGLRVTR